MTHQTQPTPEWEERLKNEWERVNNNMLWTSATECDQVSSWWIATLSQERKTLLEGIIQELLDSKKGKVKCEDKTWAAHYLGYDEAVKDAIAIVTKHL